MNKKYTSYTSEELLLDDYFIQSMKNPTSDSEIYWRSLITDGYLSKTEFEQAREFVLTMEKPRKIMSAKERNSLWTTIEVKNKQDLKKKIKRRNYYLLGTAASFLLVIFSFIYNEMKTPAIQPDLLARIAEKEEIPVSTGDIQLIVSGEKAYTVEEERADITLNEEGRIHINSELLVEEPTSKSNAKKEIAYNQLIIPKGKHSRLTLPDGTQMHINSGSRVVFPQLFQEKEREIYVDGEVFLEVARNEQSPFVVRTDKMNVKVLGTSFNLSAYKDENEQSVVLISGSVQLKSDNKEIELAPNQKATYSGDNYTISKVNVNKYIAWKDGYLLCEDENIQSVMKRLSRYYGVDIVCDPSVVSFTGNGKLDLKEDMERVLQGLAIIYPIAIAHEKGYVSIRKQNMND